jgi:hypothetical protein
LRDGRKAPAGNADADRAADLLESTRTRRKIRTRQSGGVDAADRNSYSIMRLRLGETGSDQLLEATMTTAYYSAVLDHPVETVWSLIRDFNSYPDYIDGVTDSVIEDDRRGDEVGAIRRFCYLGNWIRQRLVGHSDEQRSLTYGGIDPLPFPPGLIAETPAPASYQGTIHLRRIVEGERTFVEWYVVIDSVPNDAASWHKLFQSWIPDWTGSLERALAGPAPNARQA